jgi:hypothetical protein
MDTDLTVKENDCVQYLVEEVEKLLPSFEEQHYAIENEVYQELEA